MDLLPWAQEWWLEPQQRGGATCCAGYSSSKKTCKQKKINKIIRMWNKIITSQNMKKTNESKRDGVIGRLKDLRLRCPAASRSCACARSAASAAWATSPRRSRVRWFGVWSVWRLETARVGVLKDAVLFKSQKKVVRLLSSTWATLGCFWLLAILVKVWGQRDWSSRCKQNWKQFLSFLIEADMQLPKPKSRVSRVTWTQIPKASVRVSVGFTMFYAAEGVMAPVWSWTSNGNPGGLEAWCPHSALGVAEKGRADSVHRNVWTSETPRESTR